MDMDKSFLNKAHQLERRAESLGRQKKLDDCIQCHVEAIELYKKCLKIGDNKSVLESIRLQKEWNERQITTLQLKKAYLKRLEKEYTSREVRSSKYFHKDGIENLEAKIFRNFETHDSLICYLAQKEIINPESNCNSPVKEEKEQTPIIKGNKHPKNDSTVIEELKELSGQLRQSVQGLLVQLDDRNKEIELLKEQIKDLELERSYNEACRPLESRYSSSSTSPLITSPVTDLILDVTELKSLPQLEAISIPEIDLTAFRQFRIPEVSSKLLKKDD